MQQKKIPMRKCTGCNEMKPKKELVRVVKSPEGEISMDLTGKKSGRGAYVCRSKKCLSAAIKAKRLERAFECSIPEEVYVRLEGEMDGE
ncbi:MAG: YlxR family protein [Ruminococcaceae bacterium]|nr:YlxR family protein [Oscillospiraceae bacterium]MBR3596776.1 YlxR family protein [Clostridia bacterium]